MTIKVDLLHNFKVSPNKNPARNTTKSIFNNQSDIYLT